MKQQLTFLITAGPTREYFDPVRFISNASSGIMGYEIASAAQKQGHRVILVSGPTALTSPRAVTFVPVVSAKQMLSAVRKNAARADIIIASAAVADYRPAVEKKHKIKKTGSSITLRFVRNPDIIKTIGVRKGTRVHVGFALESRDLVRAAKKKLEEKNLDLIVANYPGVIGKTSTSAHLIDRAGNDIPLKDIQKRALAGRIVSEAVRIWQDRRHGKTPAR